MAFLENCTSIPLLNYDQILASLNFTLKESIWTIDCRRGQNKVHRVVNVETAPCLENCPFEPVEDRRDSEYRILSIRGESTS